MSSSLTSYLVLKSKFTLKYIVLFDIEITLGNTSIFKKIAIVLLQLNITTTQIFILCICSIFSMSELQIITPFYVYQTLILFSII